MKFTKRFGQERQEKRRAKRFSPAVSFLIVGTLVITAFFRGAVSNILLVTLFAGCGVYTLIGYMRRRLHANRRTAYQPQRRPANGRNAANRRYYAANRRRQTYRHNGNYGRNPRSNNNNNVHVRNRYRKSNVRRNGRYGNGQNKAV